jgi:prolyl oligopeptidase
MGQGGERLDAGRARCRFRPGELLARISELEASVQARVASLQRLPGDLYFYEKRGATDNQFKLYVRHGLKGKEKLLVDPEALTHAGATPHAMTFYSPSPSGRYVAYGLSEGGSEEASIHVLEVATLKELLAPIDRAHYSGANWMPDDSGFFYLRQRLLDKDTPETEKYQRQSAFFHRMAGAAPTELSSRPERPRASRSAPPSSRMWGRG